MQVAKWGNSLAVRLPKELVEKLGLKEGDKLELVSAKKGTASVARDIAREEALKRIRKFRGWMPKDFKFDREEAHERGWRLDESQVRPRKRKA
ncbi:MAG TPA: AbrB/MazE/SpoVT family DNA-binding domain-containing protein [Rhizomicrobium sp.]|jgi:antitoxin MazE|nr:AbrB/MazE/SpoVT family DNA-binding domain-containing protein [Rhizomicrobium sp.]